MVIADALSHTAVVAAAFAFLGLATCGFGYQVRYFLTYLDGYRQRAPGEDELTRLAGRSNLESQAVLCLVHALFWLGSAVWLPASLATRVTPPALVAAGMVLRFIFASGVATLIVLTRRNILRARRMVAAWKRATT